MLWDDYDLPCVNLANLAASDLHELLVVVSFTDVDATLLKEKKDRKRAVLGRRYAVRELGNKLFFARAVRRFLWESIKLKKNVGV